MEMLFGLDVYRVEVNSDFMLFCDITSSFSTGNWFIKG